MRYGWAAQDDHPALRRLMWRAVREGDSPYPEAHRAAWMPSPEVPDGWRARLAVQDVAVARAASPAGAGPPVGMMSLRPDGHVDLAFVAPEGRGRGVFRRLHAMVEERAAARGLSRLTTHASLMARGPFEAVGWAVVAPEVVEIDGLAFERFAMARAV